MSSRNLLPWDIYTKTVMKSATEIYHSLKDRRLLSPEGLSNKALVIAEIQKLLKAMNAPCEPSGESPFCAAEQHFVKSVYFLSTSSYDNPSITSPSAIPEQLTVQELPSGYEVLKHYSSHVVRARVNLSGEEDGTVVELLVKKSPTGQEHEPEILNLLNQHWFDEFGENSRPPFPTDIRKLGTNLFQEEFIYSRPMIPAPDEQPEPIFTRVEPLLEAVDWLHRQNVVHGDININNILATTCSVRLIDFGNARCPGIHEAFFRSATPGYRAPEAFDIAPNTLMDIFSLGATLHMLFWGSLPYSRDFEPLETPGIAHPTLKQVLDKATHLDPKQRHQTVKDLHTDLKDAIGLKTLASESWFEEAGSNQ